MDLILYPSIRHVGFLLLALSGGQVLAADCFPISQIDKVAISGRGGLVEGIALACESSANGVSYTVITPGADASKVPARAVKIFPMNRWQSPFNAGSYHARARPEHHESAAAPSGSMFLAE